MLTPTDGASPIAEVDRRQGDRLRHACWEGWGDGRVGPHVAHDEGGSVSTTVTANKAYAWPRWVNAKHACVAV